MKSKQIEVPDIGRNIKSLRIKKNLTQQELADRVGYSVRNLRRIENEGTNCIEVVNTFAQALDVCAIDILSKDVFYLLKKELLGNIC